MHPSTNPTAINKRLSVTHNVVGFSDFGSFVDRIHIGVLWRSLRSKSQTLRMVLVSGSSS